ncbi:hypothetical protein AYO28_07455 [Pseudomonas putida]|uniref:Uncharacterized protein n=1 Tax=Pseudomonas putida TaxID=303 RepID=A0A177SV85_PSEPU|nr:hypothetical protein AYO28_07455 [Pseudomonas putida]
MLWQSNELETHVSQDFLNDLPCYSLNRFACVMEGLADKGQILRVESYGISRRQRRIVQHIEVLEEFSGLAIPALFEECHPAAQAQQC